ncbi:hypothetical protein D9M71_290550 [compost metagenome]
MRVTVSVSVQLISWLVRKVWFGTITSLRSLSVMCVARMWMRLTVPVTVPMVTRSPMRTGRSNSRIRPEMKLAKIACMPKPIPTESAATSHCSLSQLTPRVDSALTKPMPAMA